MQTIIFQNAKAEHPAYLEPNRDSLQKTIEGLSERAVEITEAKSKRRSLNQHFTTHFNLYIRGVEAP
jgi:BarA-like signal transduction histidine kinase